MRTRLFLLVVFAGFYAINNQFGELIFVGDGVGWDGRMYSDFGIKAADHPVAAARATTPYHLQRMLPSCFVAATLRLLHLKRDYSTVLRVFRWYNFVVITSAVWIWTAIATRLRLSKRMVWLSTVFLFLSFPVQKQYIYVPANTDATALFLAIALFYAYIADRRLLILVVSLAGAICWPMVFYAGILMTVWPAGSPAKLPRAGVSVSVVLAAGTIVFSIYSFTLRANRPTSGVLMATLPLSVTITGIALWAAFRPLAPQLRAVLIAAAPAATRLRTYLALSSVFVVNLGVSAFAQPGGVSIHHETMRMAVEHLAKPGIAILSNTVYFGPVVLIAMYLWKHIAGLARDFGVAITIIVIEGVTQLLLDSESRRSLVVLPIIVAFTAVALDKRRLPRSFDLGILVLSVLFSECWLLINQFPGRSAEPMDFPLQLFMGHFGPWMSFPSYIAYATACIFSGIVLLLCWRLGAAAGSTALNAAAPLRNG